LAHPVDEPVELELQIPVEWPGFNEFFGFEPKPAFRLFDGEGRELAYQRLGQTNNRRRLHVYATKFPEEVQSHTVSVAVRLALPALGYTTIGVRAERSGRATRHPSVPSMAVAENVLENETLRVAIESNGSLTLLDKRTGQAYRRLLTFEDCADIGDGWYHGQAVNDQVFVSTASSAAVALVHDGPQVATLRVRTVLQAPSDFYFDDRMRRSEELSALVIDSLITLRAGADRVEVESRVHNTVEDHRLRVLFPSGAAADTYLADSPFDVVERPIALAADNHLGRELEVETKPQQSFTAVYGGGRGLSVVSAGLLESAVRDLPERPIALTLFRSTRRTVGTNGEPGGQLLGDLHFRFWIVPLSERPDPVRLLHLGQQIAGGLRSVQLRAQDLALLPPKTSNRAQMPPALPHSAGLLAVQGVAVVTSVRTVDGALEVRLFNPTTAVGEARLHVGEGVSISMLEEVDFESKPLGTAQRLVDNIGVVHLGPKQIKTLRVT
jgi:alpha-mannosidase/mannosylglycerate hydrolase